MGKNKPKKSNGINGAADLKSLLQRGAASGIAIVLATGITYAGCNNIGLGDVNIIGNGATINSELKFENCGKVTLYNFTVNGGDYNVMVVKCKALEISGVTAANAGMTGILVANTSGIRINHCHCYGAKKQHGIYLSQSCDDIEIDNNLLENNAFSGLQVNAIQDDANPNATDHNQDSMSKKVSITNNTLRNNQLVGHAGAIQLSGCYDVVIEGNKILVHNGRAGIALWDDGTGKPALACHDVLSRANTYEFSKGTKVMACITIGKNCTGIVVKDTPPAGVPLTVNV